MQNASADVTRRALDVAPCLLRSASRRSLAIQPSLAGRFAQARKGLFGSLVNRRGLVAIGSALALTCVLALGEDTAA
jgi:hypothetical protein